MRGNRGRRHKQASRLRSIPARAGEPGLGTPAAARMRVYPRACGGTRASRLPLPSCRGLSPRVRGNPNSAGQTVARIGSIPARAGEPPCRSPCKPLREVYPRACGGTRSNAPTWIVGCGLSPRVRGNPQGSSPPAWCVRSIPARAGEPLHNPIRFHLAQVYPRACGGTQIAGRRS